MTTRIHSCIAIPRDSILQKRDGILFIRTDDSGQILIEADWIKQNSTPAGVVLFVAGSPFAFD